MQEKSLSARFRAFYDLLRRIAHQRMRLEPPGDTLQTTALVNETYLRLHGAECGWNDDRHFLRMVARTMRRVLVDRARQKQTLRLGGHSRRVPLEETSSRSSQPVDPLELLALEESLMRLSAIDRDTAEIVRLRFYQGLTIEDVARKVGVSPRTVNSELKFAKAWLMQDLR